MSHTQKYTRSVPDRVNVGSSNFQVLRKLGEGGFGQVFLGKKNSISDPLPFEVAIKLEECDHPPLEWQVYDSLEKCDGVPLIYGKIQPGAFHVTVMELLGITLSDIVAEYPSCPRSEIISCVAVAIISIISGVHAKGFVHGDIKPANVMLGLQSQEKGIFLVDFGLASRWLDVITGSHVQYDQRVGRFKGTPLFASVHAHFGVTPSRRDDLESLVYTLMFIRDGGLPWDRIPHGENKHSWVREQKLAASPGGILGHFLDLVRKLSFDDLPNYANYISIFLGGVGSNTFKVLPRILHENLKMAPDDKQGMIFSASLSKDLRLACKKLNFHGFIQHYIKITESEKNQKVYDLLDAVDFNQALISVKSIDRAVEMNKLLAAFKFPSVCIHPGMTREERLTRYRSLKEGNARIIVATAMVHDTNYDDERVNLVINYDMPDSPESYLHTVGSRKAIKRLAVTFVATDCDWDVLKQIEKMLEMEINNIPEHIDPSAYI